MLSRAVVVLTVLSAALAAEMPSESHIMHVPRHGFGQQGMPMPMPANAFPAGAEDAQDPADERVFKVAKHAVPLFTKLALKPKFPFGLKEKFPFSLKKKLPVFLGGSAAAAAGAAGAGAAGSLGALGIHGLDFTKLHQGDAALLHQYPIWKVHRYNGIDLRPVRLGAPAPGGPYPAAAGPYPYPAEEPRQVYGPPPKEVAVPEPVYGPPAETYGPPAETYGPPAQTYGPPAQTYGPPAETYGPPAQTYGPPAQTYGPPAETYGPPAETYGPPANAAAPAGGPSGENIDEGLEALSQLGALTDLLPGGGSGSGGPLSSLSSLGTFLSTSGRSKGEILATLAKLKEGVPSFIKSAVTPAQAPAAPPAESAVYHPPAPTGIHGLLQGHPLISSITNGFRGHHGSASHVSLPPLPELPTLPEIKGLKEIPGIPALPHINLPTKYIAQGGPYVSVRYPNQQQQSAIAPRGQLQGQLPIPASAPAFQPAPAPVSTYSAPSAPSTASAPAVEIPAAPSSSMVPPIRPAEVYAAPGSAVGPENAIQQVSVPQASYTLPLEQPQQYVYNAPAATQVTATRGQVVNSYGQPVNQETYTYTTNQQYAAPAQQQFAAQAQYSTPVTQYNAPGAQYTAQAQQYSAPVTQYAAPPTQYGAPDAFTAASETQSTSTDAQGRTQQQQAGEQEAEDDERAELNENSRSDHIDAATDASEASEVRVAMPSGQTRAVSALVQSPAVTPVFNREEQTRRLERLEEMRQMVDQMVDLSAYLDPAHPASTARDAITVAETSPVEPTAAPADQSDATTVVNQDAIQA